MKINNLIPFILFLISFLFLGIFSAVAQEFVEPVDNTINPLIRANNCSGDLVLVIKKGNSEPACLEAPVAKKLLDIGWGTLSPEPSTSILRVGQALPTNCAEGLVLIIKNSNSKLACVTPETALQLTLRGWGTIPNS